MHSATPPCSPAAGAAAPRAPARARHSRSGYRPTCPSTAGRSTSSIPPKVAIVGTTTALDLVAASESAHIGYTAYAPEVWGGARQRRDQAATAQSPVRPWLRPGETAGRRAQHAQPRRHRTARRAVRRHRPAGRAARRRPWRDAAVYAITSTTGPRFATDSRGGCRASLLNRDSGGTANSRRPCTRSARSQRIGGSSRG